MFWTVANMSTVGVPRKSGSLFRGGDFTVIIGRDRRSAIMFRQPGMCRPRWLCLEFVAIGTNPQLDVKGFGNGSLFVPVC